MSVQPQDILNVPGQIIGWFDDLGTGNEDHRFLSNFYEGDPFTVPGWTDPRTGEDAVWKTGEHAFAALKAWGEIDAQYCDIIDATDPAMAKALGRSCRLRSDWEEVKLDVMAAIIRHKFTLDRVEGQKLIATGTALLVEGTYWGDTVWGVSLQFSDDDVKEAEGRNWLGTLLQMRRAELIAEQLYGVTSQAGLYNAKFSVK